MRADYGGINDRHMTISKRDLNATLGLLSVVFRNTSKYTNFRGNSERFLARRLAENGVSGRVRRFKPMQFVVSSAGDSTHWSKGRQLIGAGVKLKYKA